MRKLIIPVTIFIAIAMYSSFSTGCKKIIEKKMEEAQDSIIRAVIDGSWYVSNFKHNGADSTAKFNGWIFKFYNDNNVKTSKAYRLGNDTLYGTWNGDINTYTFTAKFNTTPPLPLDKIEGTWLVTSVPSNIKGSFNKLVNGAVVSEMTLTKN